MKPWARTPTDLIQRNRAVRKLSKTLRATFYELFWLARREDPLLSYLVDDHLRSLSGRWLAYLTGTPRASLQRHMEDLQYQGLLVRDLTGLYAVPLVASTERRFGPSPSRTTTRSTSSTTTRSTFGPSPETVENQGLLFGPDPPRWPTAVGRSGPLLGPTPKEPAEEMSPTETLRSAPAARLVENLPEIPLQPHDYAAKTPRAIEHDRIRELLGYLAYKADAWARVLSSPRDRAVLKRAYQDSPAALLRALEFAAYNPEEARNAGAWLTTVVREIDAQEEAS